MSASWSSTGLLEQIDGLIEEFPPIKVLFALYRLKASGVLSVQRQRSNLQLTLQGGKLVGARGAPGLLSRIGVTDESDADLMGLIGKAIAGGRSPDEALLAAADGIGDLLAKTVGEIDGYVRFENGLKTGSAPIPLPHPVPRIIQGGLTRCRGAAKLEEALAAQMFSEVCLSLPDDSPMDSWGLTPVALRLIRIIEKNLDRKPTLGQIVRKDPVERLVAADLLLQLGLISLNVPEAQPRSRSARRDVPAPQPPPAPEPPPRDPLAELTAAYQLMRSQSPWEILGLAKSADITDEGIDRANRTISRKYHPDQFTGESGEVRKLAVECFGVIQESYNAMRDETLREEVRARLEAAERGEQYITDRDRTEAELAYSRGQVAFRKKDFAEAMVQFDRANQLDPGKWRHAYMGHRTSHHLGNISGAEAARLILALDGPRGLTRADVLFEVAEILMRENDEQQAYDLYEQVLQLNPEHIGARRWVRIRRMRASAAEEEAASSLFSGLFRRKKK
jgi:curved DNA-binding protein CbpA